MINYDPKPETTRRERLNPSFSHSRYVHLRLIRKNIEYWVKEYIINKKINKLADMGCGEIPYESLFQPHVKNYIGVDLPGNPNASVIVNPETNKCELDENSCDIVLSIQVLSNTSAPYDYLKECYRILKPGGKMLLSTHGHWQYKPDPVDYGRWTSMGLKLALRRSGFYTLELKGMMGLLSTSLQLLQDAILLSIPLKNIWGKPFCFIMQRFIALSEWYITKSKTLTLHKNKDACVFFIVAKKD